MVVRAGDSVVLHIMADLPVSKSRSSLASKRQMDQSENGISLIIPLSVLKINRETSPPMARLRLPAGKSRLTVIFAGIQKMFGRLQSQQLGRHEADLSLI